MNHRVVHGVCLGASPAGDGGGLAAVVLGGTGGKWLRLGALPLGLTQWGGRPAPPCQRRGGLGPSEEV